MTEQEAIEIVKDVTWQDNGRHYGKVAEARSAAIKALEEIQRYRETGLDPNRIEEVNELYLEKCKEVNRLEAKLEEYRNYAENVLQQLIAVSFESQGNEGGMGGQKVVAMDDVVEIVRGVAK